MGQVRRRERVGATIPGVPRGCQRAPLGAGYIAVGTGNELGHDGATSLGPAPAGGLQKHPLEICIVLHHHRRAAPSLPGVTQPLRRQRLDRVRRKSGRRQGPAPQAIAMAGPWRCLQVNTPFASPGRCQVNPLAGSLLDQFCIGDSRSLGRRQPGS